MAFSWILLPFLVLEWWRDGRTERHTRPRRTLQDVRLRGIERGETLGGYNCMMHDARRRAESSDSAGNERVTSGRARNVVGSKFIGAEQERAP